MIVEAHNLVKRYPEVEAVKGVDIGVQRGETYGFLGPNGAGKSTTIKMLCTLAEPTSGTAAVDGLDVVRQRFAVRRRIGLVFQDPTLDNDLTAEENLRFHGELYGMERAVIRRRVDELLEVSGLTDRRGSLVATFSGGMKRRLEIVRGLMHRPRVLFLDEPTIGLDPQTRASIWQYVADLKKAEDITIFLTTHYMDEAENCDRIAIMDNGQIVVIDTPDALKAQVGKDRITIITGRDEEAIAALKVNFDLEGSKAEEGVQFHVAGGEQFVPRLFAELGIEISSVSVARPSLDDVFMEWTGRTIRDAESSDLRRQIAARRRR